MASDRPPFEQISHSRPREKFVLVEGQMGILTEGVATGLHAVAAAAPILVGAIHWRPLLLLRFASFAVTPILIN